MSTEKYERWQCDICREIVTVPVGEYPVIGTPYCDPCDQERTLVGIGRPTRINPETEE